MSDTGTTIQAGAPGGTGWSPGDAIAFGWSAVRANPGVVGVFFVGGLIGNALSLFGIVVAEVGARVGDRDVEAFAALVDVGLQILNVPVACWIGMGLIRYALKVVRGGRAELADVFSGGPFLTYLGAAILAGLAVLLGLALCIVPGILLAVGWTFWPYLIVDRGADVSESMGRSWRMTEGRRMDLFLFWLLVLAVNVLGIIACVVGLIVTSTLTSIAAAWTYQRFLETPPAAAGRAET